MYKDLQALELKEYGYVEIHNKKLFFPSSPKDIFSLLLEREEEGGERER